MEHNPFIALLLITTLALIIPFLLSRFRGAQLPIVVGEILAGVIIGTSGFNLIEPSAILTFLAEFGFAFLMFLAGLEVDFTLLSTPRGQERPKGWRARLAQPLPMAVAMLIATMAMGTGAGFLLRGLGMIQSPILMGLILSTTSLGVVAPVLKEQHLMQDDFGQTLLVAATVADFATLLLLTIAIAAQSTGLTLDLLLIPVLLLVFALVARVGQYAAGFPALHRVLDELSHATAQIRVRGAFFLMIAAVVLAEALGVELILGAFLAGAIVNLAAESEAGDVHEKLDAIGYGFFIPIFFIMVGVNLNVRAIFDSAGALLLVPELLAIAYAVKLIPAGLLRLRFGWRESLAGGMLLSARLSLIIAASAIALDIGAITEAVESDIIVVAIVTCTISPLAFNRLHRPSAPPKREGVIIAGGGQMAALLARRLRESEPNITAILPPWETEDALKEVEDGIRVVSGALDDPETMARAGAQQAAAMVVLASDNGYALSCCELARDRFGVPLLVAGVSDTEDIPRLQELGVRVVQPALATAMALEGALRFPTAFDVIGHSADDVELGETVVGNQAFRQMPIRRIQLPGNALILSIKRDETVMVPHGDTRLQTGDVVALIGSPHSVSEALALLAG